jgi:hypothetical protein
MWEAVNRNIQGQDDNLINMVNFLVNGALEGSESCAET